jgi:putative redox protein
MSDTADEHFVASVHSIGEDGYRTRIRAGHHELVSDEPVPLGGKDEGAAPYALLLASLAACTSITLAMYAARKQWPPLDLKIDLALFQSDAGDRIERTLHVGSPLDDEQKSRLLAIAEKTPVTKTLRRAATITTKLA